MVRRILVCAVGHGPEDRARGGIIKAERGEEAVTAKISVAGYVISDSILMLADCLP
jgi:hypothetical protein